MLAGPNGSGKSTFFKIFPSHFYRGPFVNADDIEGQLRKTKQFPLAYYGLKTTRTVFNSFINKSGFREKLDDYHLEQLFFFHDNIIYVSAADNSYVAALIAEFIRDLLIRRKNSFSFETVMSHESKLAFLRTARTKGFRTYLYFIATDSPEINRQRVQIRVKRGGHHVTKEKITERYYRTMDFLLDAVRLSDRAFLIDNSDKPMQLIAKVTAGKEFEIKHQTIPNWFDRYIIQKL